MDSDRWQRIKDVYQQALDLDPGERRAFVLSACEDAELAAEVMQLLEVPTRSASDVDRIVETAARSLGGVLADDELVGPYRILEVIGTGGMGHVYLAERADSEFEQRVAIKTANLGAASPSMLERFRLERQILADLDHRHIARLLDGGTTGAGVPYLVMEYIDGVSIVDYCAGERVALERRLELFLDICDAVQYAHRKLTVHRDIKPSNILVTRDGVPKLLDFGVAKLLDPGRDRALTREEGRILTPEYASPEQVRGEPVTTSTDVYGLGMLLYELVSGAKPFDLGSATSPEIRHLICHTDPVEPSRAAAAAGDRARAARLGGDLDRIVMKAIRKEPERRYETVRDLANDIRNFRDGLPVSARAPSWSYRAGKFLRRNRASVAATAAVFVAAVAMTAFHTLRLADERDRATLAAREAGEVSGFLASLFESASPDVSQGEVVTAVDLLNTGSEQIGRLQNQPVLQAKLYRLMGNSYTRLGDYDRGLARLEAAVRLLEGRDDSDPLILADAVASLANTMNLMQRHEDAIAGYRRALALREAELGADHPDVAFAMARLGGALGWQGRSAEALPLLRRALAIKTRLGNEDAELLDMLGVTAVNLAQSGRFEEAIAVNGRSIDVSKRLLGELHPATVIRIGNSGVFLHQAYRSAEGLDLLDESIERSERIYPPDHPDLSYSRRWRAHMLMRLGRFDEAAAELDAAAAITRAGGRERSMEAVRNVYALGRLRLERRDPAAVDAYRSGRALALELGSADGPAAHTGMIGLAIAEAYAGRLDEAERRLRDVLERRGRSQKSVDWYVQRELASVLSRQGRYAEAEQVFDRVLAEQEHGAAEPGGAAIEVLIARAAHYRRGGHHRQAEADAQRARELAAERLPAGNWIVAMAEAELARARLARERSDADARALSNAAARLRATFGTGDPRVRELDAL